VLPTLSVTFAAVVDVELRSTATTIASPAVTERLAVSVVVVDVVDTVVLATRPT
jgi:hypothetical protein